MQPGASGALAATTATTRRWPGEAASDALATAFDLTPEEVRDLLDARFGRHLADDLSFIPGGPVSREAIETHIMTRLADRCWRKWFEKAVREAKSG